MGVVKMGNIVPRVGIEPTTFSFWASILTITPRRLPDITILPMPTYLCAFMLYKSVQTSMYVYMKVSFQNPDKHQDIYIYIYAYICIYIYAHVYACMRP